jgi:hypothetical protein
VSTNLPDTDLTLFVCSVREALLRQWPFAEDFEFTDISGRLFPAIGFGSGDIVVETNFGNSADRPLRWQPWSNLIKLQLCAGRMCHVTKSRSLFSIPANMPTFSEPSCLMVDTVRGGYCLHEFRGPVHSEMIVTENVHGTAFPGYTLQNYVLAHLISHRAQYTI